MEPFQHKDLQHEVLQDIVLLIQAGKLPTAEQIDELRQCLLKDRVVSAEEADLLFYIKNTAADKATMKLQHQGPSAIPGFSELFVEAITSNLLFTGETPGALDTLEFIWLSNHIRQDYNYDNLERELLINIAMKAENLPVNFHELTKKFADDLEENKQNLSDEECQNRLSFLDRLKSLLSGKD